MGRDRGTLGASATAAENGGAGGSLYVFRSMAAAGRIDGEAPRCRTWTPPCYQTKVTLTLKGQIIDNQAQETAMWLCGHRFLPSSAGQDHPGRQSYFRG